jgi:hypothetical protein
MMDGMAMRARKVRRRNRGVWESSRLAPYRKAAAATVRQLTDAMAAFRTGWGCFGRFRGRAGWRAGRAAGGPAGMSAVSAASSA